MWKANSTFVHQNLNAVNLLIWKVKLSTTMIDCFLFSFMYRTLKNLTCDGNVVPKTETYTTKLQGPKDILLVCFG